MKRFLSSAVKDVRNGDHIDVYLALAVGTASTVMALLGIGSVKFIGSAVLFTLTLVAYSLLKSRRTLDDLSPLLQEIAASPTPTRAGDVIKPLQEYGPLDAFFEGAGEVFMTGTTMYTRSSPLRILFQQLLREGCVFRVIILDPSSPVLPRIAKHQGITESTLKGELTGAQTLFGSLQGFAQGIGVRGTFDFVQLDYAPHLTMMRVKNARTGAVSIHVELVVFGSDISHRPAFRVGAADGPLFEYFDKVCGELWKAAHPDRSADSN